MKCPTCKRDTPVNQPNCVNCGVKLKFSREAIVAEMREEAKAEQERHTARNIRRLLVWGIAFFAVALVCFFVTKSDPRPRPVPAYPLVNPPAEMQSNADIRPADRPGTPNTLAEVQPTDVWDEMPELAPHD